MSLNLSQILAKTLAEYSTQAFALMGNGNAHLINELAHNGVAITTVRHEAGTVAAADAFSRVSGKLAIATATYGAGFTNTLTALAEAAQARTPMLVVVGDAPSTGPRPWDVDQEMLAAALGVRTHTLSVTNIERTVERAVAHADMMRRPVVIAVPYDIVSAPAVPEPPKPEPVAAEEESIDLSDPAGLAALMASVSQHDAAPGDAAPRPQGLPLVLEQRIDSAAERLLEAERPFVIAGRGAHTAGASTEIGILAAALGAPTATTALARGVFPNTKYDVGVAGGFGQAAAMELIREADCVVVIGASLNQFTMRFGELFSAGTTVIRIDAEQVAAPKTVDPISHHLLQGDARQVASALTHALDQKRAKRTLVLERSGKWTQPTTPWRESVAGLESGGALRVRPQSQDTDAATGHYSDGRLDPRALSAKLAELLPADRHVTTDGGHFIGWPNMYWPVASPERMIMVGTAYQTIGLGFSTVAGVAAAAPDTTIVLATGDGGGLMALADLETTVRTAASCVVVVFNDAAYGAEVHLYGEMGLDEKPMLIPDANFAGLAEAFGATGVTVNSLADLAALEQWVAAGAKGTILLDCRVSRSVVADYQREVQRANGLVVEVTE